MLPPAGLTPLPRRPRPRPPHPDSGIPAPCRSGQARVTRRFGGAGAVLPALLRGYRGACAGCPSSQPLRGSLRWGVSAPWYLGEGGLASSTWGSVLPSSPHWRAPGRRHMEKLPLRSGLRAREGITVSGEQHSRTRGPWPVALLCVSRQRPPSCPAPRRGSSARPPDPLTGDLDDARAPAACLSSASGPRPLTQQPRWAPSEVTAPSRSPPPQPPLWRAGWRGLGRCPRPPVTPSAGE